MKRRLVTDSVPLLALDKGSVRSFDSDGRMHVSIANISKANICPYKGEEIPNWEDLGLDREKIYNMLRDPRELEAGAPTFNGVQLLKKHVPVDVEDHQMWDIVGTTGTEAKFDGQFLTNSLHVWTQEGIDFIESGDQRELSCGYHYVPDMTPGNFNGKHFDGVMRNIEGNHVALVEEGRAGPDVVVGDSALSTRDRTMKKPTRLQYAVLMRTARAINPLLAMDAKVNYAPLIDGLLSKNFKERRPKIIEGVKKLIAGKTIAKDASVEHLAKMLDTFEHSPSSEKSWDESVSEPQHKAMEAAASGESNLGIPKSVGEEFSHADKGKKFGDMIRDWAKDKGFGEEDFEALDKMHSDCMGGDETAEEGEDSDDDEDADNGEDGVIEEGAEEGEDEESQEDRDEDERDTKDKKAKDKAARDKAARDKAAKDKRKGAMDKNTITQDDMNKAISSAVAMAEKRARQAAEARQFVRPFVGEVALALDSSEKILRSAAKAMQIEDAETVHPSALKQLIKMAGQSRSIAQDSSFTMAHDGGDDGQTEDTGSFDKMFPGSSRIGMV